VAFNEAAKADPSCAMAHWGVARTWYHPIWAPPSPDELKQGTEAIKRALAAQSLLTQQVGPASHWIRLINGRFLKRAQHQRADELFTFSEKSRFSPRVSVWHTDGAGPVLCAEQNRQRLRATPNPSGTGLGLERTQAARAVFDRAAELDPGSKLLDRR
jgi:hypothetical protein